MHITLTGNLGSGKSTVCKLLTQQYGFELFSTGKVIREIADEMGISVLEMNELMSKDHKYDHMIDDKTAAISRENPDRNILFDSRLAWHFVEKSFKVFLSVDLAEAARRVFADASRGEVESYKSEEDAAEQLAARAANEDARYEELYGIHYFDFNNYNLVLDSSYAKPEVIAAVLMREAVDRSGEKPEKRGRMLISPKRLGFTQPSKNAHEGETAPGIVTVRVDGNRLTVVRGKSVVARAAEEGYSYVAARLAK
ncbi:MAG: dephospho-CoA kinase [Lachnospiraceae bacterium]|nr:dephospho-CoA kinase [Lachnospiraceae bacterium]